MHTMFRTKVFGLLMLVTLGAAQASDGWVEYDAKEYGFSMLIPEGAKFSEREYGDGWAELQAEHEGVVLYALTKRGEQASSEEIEKVGVKLTGIPSNNWVTVTKGENTAGWTWYHTVEAGNGGTLYVGDFGVGKQGSYLLILQTTESDYNSYKDDYKTWYQSIRLH